MKDLRPVLAIAFFGIALSFVFHVITAIQVGKLRSRMDDRDPYSHSILNEYKGEPISVTHEIVDEPGPGTEVPSGFDRDWYGRVRGSE